MEMAKINQVAIAASIFMSLLISTGIPAKDDGQNTNYQSKLLYMDPYTNQLHEKPMTKAQFMVEARMNKITSGQVAAGITQQVTPDGLVISKINQTQPSDDAYQAEQ